MDFRGGHHEGVTSARRCRNAFRGGDDGCANRRRHRGYARSQSGGMPGGSSRVGRRMRALLPAGFAARHPNRCVRRYPAATATASAATASAATAAGVEWRHHAVFLRVRGPSGAVRVSQHRRMHLAARDSGVRTVRSSDFSVARSALSGITGVDSGVPPTSVRCRTVSGTRCPGQRSCRRHDRTRPLRRPSVLFRATKPTQPRRYARPVGTRIQHQARAD